MDGILMLRVTPILFVATSLLTLTACNTAPNAKQTGISTQSKAVEAFTDICLKTAPSFTGDAEAAKRFGIVETQDMGFTRIGFNADKSLAVQLSEKECVVTTPSQRDDSLTQQLLAAAGKVSETPTAQSVPTKVTIGGSTFLLHHDRRGGEAYVLLRQP
jgi:hypothetical protein